MSQKSIRLATIDDLSQIMPIYEHARAFMREHGNPRQWSDRNWPPEQLIRADITAHKSHVCVADGRVVGVFFYDFGKDVEPTYATLEGGTWLSDAPYGVVHRIASDGSQRGIGTFCLKWALGQSSHQRIDTHPDNTVMQNLLAKLGFEQRGIIHVREDNDPRLAYERV